MSYADPSTKVTTEIRYCVYAQYQDTKPNRDRGLAGRWFQGSITGELAGYDELKQALNVAAQVEHAGYRACIESLTAVAAPVYVTEND